MRWLYNIAGVTCVVVGVIGAFLPLLPTTPFVLLAAFFFSKGSERLHSWLMNHPRFGPLIRDWQTHRVIAARTKRIAWLTIVVTMSPPIIFGQFPVLLKCAMAAVGLGVILLIRSYPSAPRTDASLPQA